VTNAAEFQHVLVDTGPLVAIRNPKDSEHVRCVETLRLIQPPILTCWAVITEAAWMLRHDANLVRKMLGSLASGTIAILDVSAHEVPQIVELFARYSNLSPQLADLTLLHLAQRENFNTVFTLDRRDFGVFRLKGKKRLRLLPSEA
jgi:uncharacterized protein